MLHLLARDVVGLQRGHHASHCFDERVEPAAQGFGEFVEPGDFISVFDETCDLIAQITAPSESGPVLLIIAAGGDAVLSDEVITGKQRELPLAAECLGG